MPETLLRRARTSLHLRALDARDALTGRRDPLVPPRRMNFVGEGDFTATGEEFLGHFVALGGLTPIDRVLDIGCGIGRMARPLHGFLADAGSYDGFDVNAEGVAWCRSRYADRPTFRFVAADLHNAVYNPGGHTTAAEYRFPYDDDRFDFAFATSVLTHLDAPEAAHYLRETARVLAPGGRALITFLVLDDVSRPMVARGASSLPLRERDTVTAVTDPGVPEDAIAFDREWILGALGDAGLREPAIHPGTWSGRPDGLSFQDIVVAHA